MSNKSHRKITSAERDAIAQWVSQKVAIREIARRLGKAASSVSEELARNTHMEAGYVAIHAQRLTDGRIREARRRHPLKNAQILAYVHEKLRRG